MFSIISIQIFVIVAAILCNGELILLKIIFLDPFISTFWFNGITLPVASK
nr:MAG TPA: hypothetical protein [Caudoviricetes sp.]